MIGRRSNINDLRSAQRKNFQADKILKAIEVSNRCTDEPEYLKRSKVMKWPQVGYRSVHQREFFKGDKAREWPKVADAGLVQGKLP